MIQFGDLVCRKAKHDSAVYKVVGLCRGQVWIDRVDNGGYDMERVERLELAPSLADDAAWDDKVARRHPSK